MRVSSMIARQAIQIASENFGVAFDESVVGMALTFKDIFDSDKYTEATLVRVKKDPNSPESWRLIGADDLSFEATLINVEPVLYED